MKIYILGKNSFIGSALHSGISKPAFQIGANEFIDRNISSEIIEENLTSIIVIDASGVSRGSENEFFNINFEQKIKIINKLKEIRSKHENVALKYVYLGSIHDGLDTLYGLSKRFVKHLIEHHLLINDIECFIIRLCGIYGPGVKPNKFSVVGTFYHNILNKLKCEINKNSGPIALAHVNEVILHVNCFIDKTVKNNLLIETICGGSVSVTDLHEYIIKISREKEFNAEEYVYNELEKYIKGIK